MSEEPDHLCAPAARNGAFNMMHDFWEEVVTALRCPAVKVELVRDNPLAIDLSRLLEVIGDHTDYDPDLIRNHMRRIKAKHLPPPTFAQLGSRRRPLAQRAAAEGEVSALAAKAPGRPVARPQSPQSLRSKLEKA